MLWFSAVDIVKQRGDTLTLTCQSNGQTAIWTVDGKDKAEESETYGQGLVMTINITQLDMQASDAGNYQCVANDGGETTILKNYTVAVISSMSADFAVYRSPVPTNIFRSN